MRIVQCLCGPARHCIVAIAYMPGITSAQKELRSFDDVTLTEANAAKYTEGFVEELIAVKAIYPWCGICNAKRPAWVFEDSPTKYHTMEEAEAALGESQRQQAITRQMMEGRN